MEEVFDLYTQKTKLYYALQGISLLTIGFIVYAKMADLQLSHKYQPVLIAAVVFGLSAIVTSMLLAASSVRMYIKSGELTISEGFASANQIRIEVKDIEKVEVSADDYRGRRASDGSGNRIQVIASDKRLNCKFVIQSQAQQNNLNEILARWKKEGVKFI